MGIEKILEQKEQISAKKAKLEMRERMLKDKERKIRTKRLIQAGELISKAEIEHLDASALLGALLEIKEKSKNAKSIHEWSEKGKAVLAEDQAKGDQQLILSFESEFSPLTKSTLKSLKFKWNQFRKEWYGFGKKEEIYSIFKDQDIGVKIIEVTGI